MAFQLVKKNNNLGMSVPTSACNHELLKANREKDLFGTVKKCATKVPNMQCE